MRSILSASFLLFAISAVQAAASHDRPNILWITSEDNGPQLGCYGDTFATTPNLDALAARSLLYLHAWSTAPVCAPARTAIISGLYPSATGSEHMRSDIPMPTAVKMFPQLLRQAGYYCSNNSKEDYNLRKPGDVWNESSPRAHWRNRAPGQPFFAVFNHTITHESQIRHRPHTPVHDPHRVPLPPYHPDTPEVRQDWAQYYDRMTEMDRLVGANLRELEDAGLADNTIVFYYGDHGPGMPRGKRWLYDSGLHVPLIIHVPDKWRFLAPPDYAAGGRSSRLVSFVDLAPTVLSLAGVQPPDTMHGRAFMGPHAQPPETCLYALRGRMDERIDLLRAARDTRYLYIRNFMPHKPYGQHVSYSFETPSTRVWKHLFDTGQLHPPRTAFWQSKPPEELYDVSLDPHQILNLAASPEHQQTLQRLRENLRHHALLIRDLGFLPEPELHSRSGTNSPYDMARDEHNYPLPRILATAERASDLRPDAIPDLLKALDDPDSAVRYWAAMGFLMRGSNAVHTARTPLLRALLDPAPSVRLAAAEALAQHGNTDDLNTALPVLLDHANVSTHGLYVAVTALNAIDDLDHKAASHRDLIEALPRNHPSIPPRLGDYVGRLLDKTLADLTTPNPAPTTSP
jgi:arylsulfatase A-like enzyme